MRNLLASFRALSLFERIPVVAMLRRQASRVRVASDQWILRVAERWLLADDYRPSAEQDTMARLQVLEGAAGVSVWTWSRNPRRGMAQARLFFADKPGVALNPSWLVYADTGMVTQIFRTIAGMLSTSGAGGEMRGPADILINGLMGMGADGESYPGGPTLYGVGKALADKVLSGVETPLSVAKGTGARQFKQRAIDAIRGLRTKQRITGPQMRNDEETGEIPDLKDDITFAQYVADRMGDRNSPEGKVLRNLFVMSASDKESEGHGSYRALAQRWTEEMVRGTDIATINLILAKEFGYTSPAQPNKIIMKIIQPVFWSRLQKSPLFKKLEQGYEAQNA